MFDLPFYLKEILSLTVNYSVTRYVWNGITYYGRIDFSLLNSQNQILQSFAFPRTEAVSLSRTIPINRAVPAGENYRFYMTVKAAQDQAPGTSGGDGYGGCSVNSVTARVKVLKSMGFQ